MYSPLIIDQRLRLARRQFPNLKRRPRDESIEITARLERLRLNKDLKPLPDGQLARELLPSEQAFIDSERLLCKIDFQYYFERYHKVEIDPGVVDVNNLDKIAPPILAESQLNYIRRWGVREEECYVEVKQYKFTEGIRGYIHKVRQVMATATVRAASMHRMVFWPGTRSFAASLDEDRLGELYKRDLLGYNNLPFWLKPRLSDEVKNTELAFEAPISSRLLFQAENSENGIGTGSQFDFSHLTEVALWKQPGQIRYSFVPAMPKSISTFHMQESTADGKGNYWHEVSEAARHHRAGYETWIYCFVPWYMNKLKYRANPPTNWKPSELALKHALLCERSSPEFFDGKTVMPTREQLYWWERTRAQHAQHGELAVFLTNYPATPEQSFQSPAMGALPVELIEEMEMETVFPEATFDFELVPTE